MTLRPTLLAGLLAATALFPGAALAVDENNVTSGATMAGPGLAIHGYDAASFFVGQPVVGSAKYQVAYDGATYRFATQENLNKFKADPGKFVPAYGGYCAYGAALGKKFDGDPQYWRIVEGKLYLNLNEDIQSKWSENIPGNITKADRNWPNIESVAPEKL